jgi:heptosyltransferase-2
VIRDPKSNRREATLFDARGPVLIVAPSWVGDAILSEPLIARLATAGGAAAVDVLAPAWCAPVYARMRGIRRIFDSMLRHGELGWARRRTLARTLSARLRAAIILPNSWKSALVPWLAGIPSRTGYTGEARFGILNDRRRLDPMPCRARRSLCALAATDATAPSQAPVADSGCANRDAAVGSLGLELDRGIAILCPGAEFGPAKRWPAEHFASLARKFLATGSTSGSWARRTTRAAARRARGCGRSPRRDPRSVGSHRPRHGDRSPVARNRRRQQRLRADARGRGGASAARRAVRLVVARYTPPMSERANIARIDIACSPCFKRECPLGHFKCMRELSPDSVYDLARVSQHSRGPSANRSPYP